jgi:hypothetical protein
MKYGPWIYLLVGAAALWFIWGRKVNASVTTGDIVIRYPTKTAIDLTATSSDAAQVDAMNAIDAPASR